MADKTIFLMDDSEKGIGRELSRLMGVAALFKLLGEATVSEPIQIEACSVQDIAVLVWDTAEALFVKMNEIQYAAAKKATA